MIVIKIVFIFELLNQNAMNTKTKISSTASARLVQHLFLNRGGVTLEFDRKLFSYKTKAGKSIGMQMSIESAFTQN